MRADAMRSTLPGWRERPPTAVPWAVALPAPPCDRPGRAHTPRGRRCGRRTDARGRLAARGVSAQRTYCNHPRRVCGCGAGCRGGRTGARRGKSHGKAHETQPNNISKSIRGASHGAALARAPGKHARRESRGATCTSPRRHARRGKRAATRLPTVCSIHGPSIKRKAMCFRGGRQRHGRRGGARAAPLTQPNWHSARAVPGRTARAAVMKRAFTAVGKGAAAIVAGRTTLVGCARLLKPARRFGLCALVLRAGWWARLAIARRCRSLRR